MKIKYSYVIRGYVFGCQLASRILFSDTKKRAEKTKQRLMKMKDIEKVEIEQTLSIVKSFYYTKI